MDYGGEFQRLIVRYQLAWDHWEWADPLHQDQAMVELTATVIALNTFIQEQKTLAGFPTRGQYYSITSLSLNPERDIS